MLVLALLTAPVIVAAPTLGPFQQGQSFADASAAAVRTALRLQLYNRSGHLDSYAIMKGQSDVRGTVGVCNGRVQFASFNVENFDDFTTLLRTRVEQWGQPEVKVVPVPLADASRSIELMSFKWVAHNYKLEFSARQTAGMYGWQSFGDGLKCL